MVDEKKNDKGKAVKLAHCVCSKTSGLFVPNRYLSGIVAGIMISLFFSFIVGFFGGKRFMVQSFLDKATQDSFGDQMYASLCALTDQDIEQDVQAVQEDEYSQDILEVEGANNALSASQNKVAIEQVEGFKKSNDILTDGTLVNEESLNEKITDGKKYYAQLIGFSTIRAAQRCCQRLNNKGFAVEVKTRTSKTARGKHISWYQIVTNEYENKKELEDFVDRITQQEKIRDIKITAVC